jgi:hypothetical protein
MILNMRSLRKLSVCGLLAFTAVLASQLVAQHLTLEGQTGGFITPTAYVVYSGEGQVFSHPAVGYHFVNTSKVIGNVQTVSIVEGIANRAEVGYTRSIHTLGDSTNPSQGAFSELWNYSGMNIFSGKVVAIRDGRLGPWTPGIAAGFVVRTNDHFVSSAVNRLYLGGKGDAYTNEDFYVAVTKTWAHPPLPFLVNLGWKATNATIFGLGGQSTRFGGRLFGGLGIPLPGPFKTVIVPSAGFTQEPQTSKNLGSILVAGKADLPTSLDYAVRVTQKTNPHFSFDIGIGQVAGNIGAVPIVVGGAVVGTLPVNLEARHVLGTGLSYRY